MSKPYGATCMPLRSVEPASTSPRPMRPTSSRSTEFASPDTVSLPVPESSVSTLAAMRPVHVGPDHFTHPPSLSTAVHTPPASVTMSAPAA